MKPPILLLLALCLVCCSSLPCAAQITVNHHDDVQALVENVFVSGGVKVFNVQFTGDNGGNVRALGSFQRGAGGPVVVFPQGIILSTGDVRHAIGPNRVINSQLIEADASYSYGADGPGDPDLQDLVIPQTYDAAALEFDFEAQSDSVVFRYIFASEEYVEWVDEKFNDVFAFFISGPGIIGKQNIALLADGNPVAVNSVNHLRNTQFYIDNPYFSAQRPAPHNIRYDGFTTVLVAKAKVIPCRRYHLKIAIADVEDQVIDSAVLLEAYSLSSILDTARVAGGIAPGANQPATWESCADDLKIIYKRRDSSGAVNVPFNLTGTARNLVDYRLSSYSFNFPAGVDSIAISVSALRDLLPEGTENVSLTYTPINSCEPRTLRFYIQDANPRLIVQPTQTITRCGLPGDTVINLRAQVELTGGDFSIEWRDRLGRLVNANANWPLTLTRDTVLYAIATDRLCGMPELRDSVRIRLLHQDRNNPLAFDLPDTLVCTGAALTYAPAPRNGTGNYSYQWQDGSRLPQYSFTANSDLSLQLRVSDECQSATRTAQVRLHRSSVEVPAEMTLCRNASLSHNPTLSSTTLWRRYAWTNLTSNEPITTERELAGWIADEEALLRFEAEDGCGMVYADTLRIRLFPEPAVLLGDTVGVCEGDAWQVNPTLSGAGLRDFVWTRISDGQVVSRERTLIGTGQSDERFSFTMSDTCGITLSREISLRVTPRNLEVSEIEASPALMVCPGTQARLSVTAQRGSGFYTYRWSEGSSTASISPVIDGRQDFSVEVSDGCLTFERNITLDVFPIPVLRLDTRDTTLCNGSSLTLTAQLSGGSGEWENIRWYDSAQNLLHEGTSFTAPYTQAAQIEARVLDGCGRQAVDRCTVNIYPVLSLQAMPDTLICAGDDITLLAQAQGAGGYQYRWRKLLTGDILGDQASLSLQPTETGEYELEASDRCFTRRDTFQIRVIPPDLRIASLSVSPANRVCFGTTVTLTAELAGGTGNYQYQWSTGETSRVMSQRIEANSSFRLTYSDDCQTLDTTVHVTVYPLPFVYVPDSSALCTGEPVTLIGTASGGTGGWTRIAWTAPTGALLGDQLRLRFEPTREGFHRLEVEDECGFKAVDSTWVRLKPVAQLQPPPDAVICRGQAVRIAMQAQGATANTRYDWSPPTGLNDPTRLDPTANPSQSTLYQLRAWSDGCASRPVEVQVAVLPLPEVNLSAEFNYCAGRDSILLAPESVSGAEPFSFRWSPESSFGQPRQQSTKAAPTTSLTFTLRVTDSLGCVRELSRQLNVHPLPVIKGLADTFFCKGEAGVQLRPRLREGAAETADWLWQPTVGLFGPNLASPWASPDSSTNYRLAARSKTSGCVSDTIPVRVSVFARPIVDAGADQSLCVGDTVSLSAFCVDDPAGKYSYHWSPSDWISTTEGPVAIAWPQRSLTYFVYAADSLCSGPLDSLRLEVRPTPTVALPPLIEICRGDEVSVEALLSGGVPPYRLKWTPSEGLSSDTSRQVIASPDSTTEYRLQVWGGGCRRPVQDSMTALVHQPPNFGAAPGPHPRQRRIYRGERIRLEGWSEAGDGAVFQWRPAETLENPNTPNPWATPDSSTTYYLEVKDGLCRGIDSVWIEVVDRVHVSLQSLSSIPVCEGDSLHLLGTRNLPTVRLFWNPEPDTFRAFDTIASYVPALTRVYRLIGIDTLTGETDTAWIEVAVRPRPVAAFDWGIADPCSSAVVSFENRSLQGISYVWYFGDDSRSSNLEHPVHEYPRDGVYRVHLTVSSASDCSDSYSDLVRVVRFDSAEVEFETEPALPVVLDLPNASVSYRVNARNAKTIWWDWGDGTIDRNANATRQYQKAGFYSPLLVVLDSANCRREYALPHVEIREPVLHIPNAFSPNGDGLNDIWQVFYRGSEEFHLRVYGRSGKVLYDSKNPVEGWNGDSASESAYTYLLRIGGKEYRGVINLIR